MTTMVVLLTVLRVKLMINMTRLTGMRRNQSIDCSLMISEGLLYNGYTSFVFFLKAATNSGWRRPYNCGFEALTKDHVLPG